MKLLVRLAAGRHLLLLALLLHGVILSEFSARTTVASARFHVRETELQRSLARYRVLLENDDSRGDLVKSQEPEISPEHEEHKETTTEAVDAVQNPEKNVDEFQAAQGVELEGQKDDQTEAKENNLHSETIEEQKRYQEEKKQSQDQQQDSVGKTEKPNSRAENRDEVIEQQTAEEVESEGKNQEEKLKVDKVEMAEEEGEASVKTEEQHEQGEEQKEPEVQKTVSESESNAENQQQGEIREEPQSSDENQQQDEVREEAEVTTEEQQTEETEEAVSKPEENKSEDWKKSEEKNEEKTTEESKESESKSKNEKTNETKEQTESKTEEEQTADQPFVFPEPYLLGPTIKDWDEQRKSWLEANPSMKSMPDGKPHVLIVTGSQSNPCRSPVGDFFNLKSLKLKIDYARMHNYEIYYNFAWLDPLFGSYWVKLPILRKLMLTHPEIEWFFWIDSDAVFTDMIFEAPFHTYDAEEINMIMWGYHQGFYVEKSWVSFNAGVFIIRNCQWSLDLIDKWSPMGPDGPVRDEYGKILTSYLSYRIENYPADDQSALAYLILTDEAVKSKVKLVELTDYMVSAWWVEVVDNYEASMEKYHPGLGDWRWPWITHFTGCGPCGGDGNNPNYQKCMKNIERALNFAENQVLAYMGFQHESLSSNLLIRTRNESDRPLDFVGVNPWEERIAQVAAVAS